jgi:hypothetical protein
MKRAIFLLLFLFFFFLSSAPAKAVTVNITNSPSSVGSESFEVQVYIEGPNPGTNYLRVDLFKEGSTKYFGETFNGSSWYGGSDGSQYFPVTIDSESTASATVQTRVGSPSTSEYLGPGDYKLRIRRYTSSGNPASGDDQTPVDIRITWATPTPTPSPTPTESPTSNPTPTPTPSPTSTPVLTSTPKPTLRSTLKPTVREDEFEEGEEVVLGLRDELSPSESPESEEEEGKKGKVPFVAIGFILGGIVFIGFSGFLFFKRNFKGYNEKHDQEEVDQENFPQSN